MADAEQEAVAAARAELAEAEGVFGPDHPHSTKLRVKIADALNAAGRHAEELPERERILADLTARNGADDNDTAVASHNYGFCLYRNDRADEGIAYIERARRDIAPFVKPHGPALFFLCRNLSTVYQAASRTGDAIALLEEITDVQRDLTVVDAKSLRGARVTLTELYRQLTGPGAEQARAKGEALWQLIVKTQQESSSPDDPQTLRELNQFAVYYARLGWQRKALPLYRRTLEARERVLGAEDSETQLSRSNLGICHAAFGDRESAVTYFEPLYEQRLRLLGVEHEDTLDTLDRLAVCLYNLRRYEDAEKYFGRLVEIREKLGGKDDRERATYLHWLGWSQYHTRRYGPAIESLRACLTDRERILGASHKDTIGARHDVGDFYQARGDYDEAIPLLRRTLEERTRVLGADHADTVKTRSVLAKALISDDQEDEGADRRRENAESLARANGRDDPETIKALLYLGYAEESAERYPAAYDAYASALKGAERALGPEHTDTVEARRCVAFRHQWAGRFDQAVPLFERVLENFRRNHGDDSAKTVDIRWSLARCTDGSGDCEQALDEYRIVLAAAERELPEDKLVRLALSADLAQSPPEAWWNREVLTGRRLWQVALGAVIRAEYTDQGHTLDTLYVSRWLDGYNTEVATRRWWGITDREGILESLERLETVGQRAKLADELGHAPLAWDIARYANNVRDAATIGWLGESESWELLDKITAMTAQTYDSWPAFLADYFAGRQLWAGLDPEDPNSWPLQHRRKAEAAQRLLDPANATSVFNRAPWGVF
jgi:tetratricopeptide (TPR) repeat protein